jgi:hypothetical protein
MPVANPVIIPPSFGEFTWSGFMANGRTYNVVLGYKNVGATTPTQNVEAIADRLETLWTAGCSNAQTMGPSHVRENVGGVLMDGDDGTVTVGTRATPGESPQVALLVKKLTGLAGKSFRGRSYFPFVPESEVDDAGDVDSVVLAAIQTALATFLAGMTTDGTPMYLLHRNLIDHITKLPVPGSAPQPTLVTSYVAESVVATQRRRLRG